MNVKEGLEEIRQRLDDRGARRETLKAVDAILQRAALPAAQPASANSLLQLTRMLMRTPMANSNTGVYDDLVGLEAELEGHAEQVRQRVAEDEGKPMPKSRKYYRQLKEKEHRPDS